MSGPVGPGGVVRRVRGPRGHRLPTETKNALKTTEFAAYVLMVFGVLIASALIGREEGHLDYFRGDLAWTLIVVLTVGYLLSRGLAKSGSPEVYDDGEVDRP